jgi:hypothetical protein
MCVHFKKLLIYFFIVGIYFLGGWQPSKASPRKQLFTLAIEGCQGNNFPWRLPTAKKTINSAVVDCQENY